MGNATATVPGETAFWLHVTALLFVVAFVVLSQDKRLRLMCVADGCLESHCRWGHGRSTCFRKRCAAIQTGHGVPLQHAQDKKKRS